MGYFVFDNILPNVSACGLWVIGLKCDAGIEMVVDFDA